MSERPLERCGNCARFIRDPKRPGHGWCDEWAGVELTDDCVCHPYVGRPKAKADSAGAKEGEKK
nr:MAG TPA: High-potential iron-sulfur protein-SULFUR CLUSTER, ELECTRON TRANSPORT, Iron [Caudoviricetes sp.]